ncbi:hypothetical protein [Sorangium sp. So ce854]|uniref:hypothetical protein n=1 Tax=Sorangium sp. So ce854 TaxID=3133322 RepID=UPI003F5EDAE4
MRNALAPRATTSSEPRPRRLRRPGRRLACQRARRGSRPDGAGLLRLAPPRGGAGLLRLAPPRGGAERLEASRRDVVVRRGLTPDREARATTLVAPGGGHE